MTREEFLSLSTEEQFRVVQETTGVKVLLDVASPTDDRAVQSRQYLAEAVLRQWTDQELDARINADLA